MAVWILHVTLDKINKTKNCLFFIQNVISFSSSNAVFVAVLCLESLVWLWLTVSVLCFSPFYGEDFYFEIPRPFQCLSFYVYAKTMFQIRDLPVGQYLSPLFCLMYKTNTQCTCQLKIAYVFVGKVAIRKEDLYKYCGKENWFHLQPVDPNSEVQVSEYLDGIEVIQHTNTPNRATHEYTALLPFCG